MEKTHVLSVFAVAFALVGMSSAFAEINSYEMEKINWVTGEIIPRTTINATCGERNSFQMQFTYFDDYVHVLTIENGDYDLQRYYNYVDFISILNELTDEAIFC